jgi:hypothetical protein
MPLGAGQLKLKVGCTRFTTVTGLERQLRLQSEWNHVPIVSVIEMMVFFIQKLEA